MNQDIRWKQRFKNYQRALSQLKNYQRALSQLTKFVQKENLNELEEQGLIQAFEYTHESHTYNEEIAKEIVYNISMFYHKAFCSLEAKLNELINLEK